MSFEQSEFTIERYDDFVVAGVAKRGTDIDANELWTELDDFADDLEDVAVSPDKYGVIYEMDEGGDEVTFLAGYEVESVDSLPPEVTAVEIPEASYAVFSLRGVDLDEMIDEIDEELLVDTDRESAEGPVFQRYATPEEPFDYDSSFELFVPVEAE